MFKYLTTALLGLFFDIYGVEPEPLVSACLHAKYDYQQYIAGNVLVYQDTIEGDERTQTRFRLDLNKRTVFLMLLNTSEGGELRELLTVTFATDASGVISTDKSLPDDGGTTLHMHPADQPPGRYRWLVHVAKQLNVAWAQIVSICSV